MKTWGKIALIAGGALLAREIIRRNVSTMMDSAFGGLFNPPTTNIPSTGTFKDWIDPQAPTKIRATATPLEALAQWPNLGNFLAAVSYTESRGNPNAGASDYSNDARGRFGLRPLSAKTVEYGYIDPNILKKPPIDVVLAADHAARLEKYADPGQLIDWLAVRRGWARPDLVDDVNENDDRSREVRERFETALAAVGLPDSFKYVPAFPSGYNWPGFFTARNAVTGVA